MVSEAFVETADEGELESHRHGEVPGYELGGQADVQFVHLVVGVGERVRCGRVPFDISIGRLTPHGDPDPTHLPEQAANSRRELTGDAAGGPPGDVLGQVVAALELGHDAQHRDQEAEIGCHRRLQHQLVLHQALDVEVERVDQVIAFHQRLRRLDVARQQRVSGRGQAFAYQCEQLHDLAVDLPKI